MESPRYGGIPLLPSRTPVAGAAFGLQKPAAESECVALDGREVEVAKGQEFVVARGGGAVDYQGGFRDGNLMAQHGRLSSSRTRTATSFLHRNSTVPLGMRASATSAFLKQRKTSLTRFGTHTSRSNQSSAVSHHNTQTLPER